LYLFIASYKIPQRFSSRRRLLLHHRSNKKDTAPIPFRCSFSILNLNNIEYLFNIILLKKALPNDKAFSFAGKKSYRFFINTKVYFQPLK